MTASSTRTPTTTDATAATAAPVVHTVGLAKHFGDVHAVERVDLSIPPNSIFGFLGPNGAGKTTTIKMLVGLLRPTAGRASVLGMDATRQSLALRRRIGYLPQQPVFYEDMTARETLAYAGRFFPIDAAELPRRIGDALDVVGLDALADRSVAGFSGGERQRLGLAQAALHDPELLILDEPAAGLDPIGRRDVLLLLERLRERCTVLYSTHILDDVQRVSDAVAIVRRGVVIAQGPIDTMLAGQDGTVFRIELVGDSDELAAAVRRQAWVSSLEVTTEDGVRVWYVAVADEDVADERLLRSLVTDPGVRVLRYGRHRQELEDVFVQLVEDEEVEA